MSSLLAHIPDCIGIVGVILILISYYFLNTQRMTAFDVSYQMLNFWGACLILVSLMFSWNTASVVIEVAWIFISLIGLKKALKSQSKRPCVK